MKLFKVIVVFLTLIFSINVISKAKKEVKNTEMLKKWEIVNKSKNIKEIKVFWKNLNLEDLEKYLDKSANVNIKNKRKWTPLHSAARYNSNLEIIKKLIEKGAIVNAKDKSGDTPLHWAAANNSNPEIILLLLKKGAKINDTDKFGWTSLHTAAHYNKKPEIVKTLINAGANKKKRAYYILFSWKFLMKHNENMKESDKKMLLEMFK